MQGSDTTGLIFDVKRFAIHDGPGIRTTVFFKGCPLRCGWCQNPEGMHPRPEIAYSPELCIGCGRCADLCPEGAHSVSAGQHVYDRSRCVVSGVCAEHCPTEALRLIGRQVSAQQVLEVLSRDRAFYEKSGGGITLSGGEPMMQPAFACQILAGAADQGLHTCVDTSGHAPWEHFEAVLPFTHLFLYDLKDTDEQHHRDSTGVGLELILGNLRRLDAAGAQLVLRCPIARGVNDREQHFKDLAALWKSLRTAPPMELIPYHRLGEAKWETLGKAADRPHFIPARRDAASQWADRLRSHGARTVELNAP